VPTMGVVFAQTPRISATPLAEQYIRAHGGRLFIWPSHHRCCGGRLTLLETSTQRPPNRVFEGIDGGGIAVFVDASLREKPEEIQLGLRGLRRKRIEAYWNGCAFVI
jgi:hypothetical protein